jgi:hypothetical protein
VAYFIDKDEWNVPIRDALIPAATGTARD